MNDSYLTRKELDYIDSLCYDNMRFCEIGTYKGGTVRYLASRYPTSEFYTIDIIKQANLNMHNNIIQIIGDSNRSNLHNTINNIDLLFIDGSHEYEDVRRDYFLWMPNVKKGGLITFHDSTGKGKYEAINGGLIIPNKGVVDFISEINLRKVSTVDTLSTFKVEHVIEEQSLELADLIESNNLLSGAEIGVYNGKNLFYLLGRFSNLDMIGVDPWVPFEYMPHSSQQWKQIQASVMEKANKYNNRLTIYNMPSSEAIKYVSDTSLDFVLIDANHDYEHFKEDLDIWYRKVKVGGFITGHDYWWEGVKKGLELCPYKVKILTSIFVIRKT